MVVRIRREDAAQPAGRCNDLDPNWVGDAIYFRSDRDGDYNVYAFDTKTKNISRLTNYDDFPVLDIGAGGGKLIYEQAGYLHLFDAQKKEDTRLKIGLATDLVEVHISGPQKFSRQPSAARGPGR